MLFRKNLPPKEPDVGKVVHFIPTPHRTVCGLSNGIGGKKHFLYAVVFCESLTYSILLSTQQKFLSSYMFRSTSDT